MSIHFCQLQATPVEWLARPLTGVLKISSRLAFLQPHMEALAARLKALETNSKTHAFWVGCHAAKSATV